MGASTFLLIGLTVFLALGAVAVTAALPKHLRAIFVYGQLVLIVGIYVGFSIYALDNANFITRADWSALLMDGLIAVAFMGAGLFALSSNRYWLLGIFILLHGAIDLGHLIVGGSAPALYGFLCIIFDGVAGPAYVWLFIRNSSENTTVH